jgi:hypothetical protein
MTNNLASLRRQLAEAEENLRLIQERKAEHPLSTDVPLHLIKEERSLKETVDHFKERIQKLEGSNPGDANSTFIKKREFRIFNIPIWSVSEYEERREYRIFAIPLWIQQSGNFPHIPLTTAVGTAGLLVAGTISVLLGIYTNTPGDLSTQVSNTPIPITTSPYITPTPTPDPLLFSDDFEDGIDSNWEMTDQSYDDIDDSYTSKFGMLTVYGKVQSTIVGDATWQNYRVRVYDIIWPSDYARFSVAVRVQNKDNFIAISCNIAEDNIRADIKCEAYEVIDAEWHAIPGTEFTESSFRDSLIIEVDGNSYHVYYSDDVHNFSNMPSNINFINDAYTTGGILFIAEGNYSYSSPIEFEGIEVETLPTSE